MGEFRIETDRLILRAWREADVEPLHAMGQEARVMEFLGPLTDRAEAERIVRGQALNQSLFGHCFWAVERREYGEMIGFCGVNRGPEGHPLEGKLEIGWRLAHNVWGKGYAHEGARATLDWVWNNCDDDRLWSMTTPGNLRSRGLMERLGMRRHHDLDFDHPDVPDDSLLRAHVIYSISRPA
jgi:RimJ/RimL family protein N-acetyltransferase